MKPFPSALFSSIPRLGAIVALSLLVASCGGGQSGDGGGGDEAPTIEASSITQSKQFGQPRSPEEKAIVGERLSAYFNGSHAATEEGLIGSRQAANGASFLTKAALTPTNAAQRVHRFFNTRTGVHFYTISEEEKQFVQNHHPIFQYEGPTFLSFSKSESVLSPVYRFYNKVSGTHFYTINETEKDHVIATWPDVFTFEGIGWYASKVKGDSWVPIYRFFNKTTGTHFYTPNETEKQNVIDTLPQFVFEGVGYYVKVPSTAPEPLQLQVDKAVLKADVLRDAQAFLTQIDKTNFLSGAGRTWTVGQVFLFNGVAHKVSGFLINPDGTVSISTVRVPLSDAYSDLKFSFKAHALAYEDNLTPVPAAKLAAKQATALSGGGVAQSGLRKSAVTGIISCLIPKQTISGLITTDADMEWGYTFELNNCSLSELLQLNDSSFVNAGVNVNGTVKITSLIKHEYDLKNSTNLTTTSSSADIDVRVSGSLTQVARSRLSLLKDVCKQENGQLVCEKPFWKGPTKTVLVGGIPITMQVGGGIKFTVDINGGVVFRGTSGYELVEGTLNGTPVKEPRQTASSFYLPELAFDGDAELDFFGYGYTEAGIGVEALDVEGYLAKINVKGGVFGTAAVKAAPLCANFSGGLRASGEIEALRLGNYYLAKLEAEYDWVLASGSLPAGCSAPGRVRLDYVMTGTKLYTPNYTAYGADIPVDVFDASMDFFNPAVDSGLKRIDLTATPPKAGSPVSYEFAMQAGTTSNANLVNFTQGGGDVPYTRVFIDPGNTTYGDVIKFKITAYDPSDRAHTESVRQVEIRIEPALAANPEYETVITTNGDEQYLVRYHYGGTTAMAIRSGYLSMAGASALHFNVPSYGVVQSFKELPLYNDDQRVFMRPTQLALLGKHDRDGNAKLFNVAQRTDVVVGHIGISPVNPTVGQLITLTVNGERLPAALAVTVPNCTGLQELRSAGNIARNNFATGVRVYECTADAPGTNLIARVGPDNTPYVFSIGAATGTFSLVGSYSKEECVKDNTTGLIWEGKTASGMRAGSNRYTNFDNPTLPQRRVDSFYFVNPTLEEIAAPTNSVGYQNYVNSIALCGYTDWRVPTLSELQSLVHTTNRNPAIDTSWFPNTASTYYWSSSPDAGLAHVAWGVFFSSGEAFNDDRNGADPDAVRLVRGSASGGGFLVYANNSNGTEFIAPANVTWCNFSATGQWSGGEGMVSASGIPNKPDAPGYPRIFGGAPYFSLIIQSLDGYYYSGLNAGFPVWAGKSLRFMINEGLGVGDSYLDNAGVLNVSYSCN